MTLSTDMSEISQQKLMHLVAEWLLDANSNELQVGTKTNTLPPYSVDETKSAVSLIRPRLRLHSKILFLVHEPLFRIYRLSQYLLPKVPWTSFS